ncbi:MAG: hypothetical protein V3U88_04050 [Methylococcales bacterium]
MRYLIVVVLHLCACFAPLFVWHSAIQGEERLSAVWPVEFEGIPLTRIEMTEQEKGFSQDFPGQIARFTDGSREIIMRYIERPSRKVHPSADCLLGSGYTVETQPISRDGNDQLWGCILAHREGITYKVCERIYDQSGNSWYDVSSWYWAGLLGNTQGPWWAITVAQQVYTQNRYQL